LGLGGDRKRGRGGRERERPGTAVLVMEIHLVPPNNVS